MSSHDRRALAEVENMVASSWQSVMAPAVPNNVMGSPHLNAPSGSRQVRIFRLSVQYRIIYCLFVRYTGTDASFCADSQVLGLGVNWLAQLSDSDHYVHISAANLSLTMKIFSQAIHLSL